MSGSFCFAYMGILQTLNHTVILQTLNHNYF
jgi:hypothetical protein